ncbi:MAG TPA: hypothetical protein VF288_05830 [Mycobacteriales bacterium]
MALILIILAAIVLVAAGTYASVFRRDPGDDVDRFHHARQITSSWSQSYRGSEVREQPEAAEDKPELQSSVHLTDA